METSKLDVPIQESVTYIAKSNDDAQAVYLYYGISHFLANQKVEIKNTKTEKLWTH